MARFEPEKWGRSTPDYAAGLYYRSRHGSINRYKIIVRLCYSSFRTKKLALSASSSCECRPDRHTVCIRLAPKSSANQTDKAAAFVGKKHSVCIRLAPKSNAKQKDKEAAIVGKQLLL